MLCSAIREPSLVRVWPQNSADGDPKCVFAAFRLMLYSSANSSISMKLVARPPQSMVTVPLLRVVAPAHPVKSSAMFTEWSFAYFDSLCCRMTRRSPCVTIPAFISPNCKRVGRRRPRGVHIAAMSRLSSASCQPLYCRSPSVYQYACLPLARSNAARALGAFGCKRTHWLLTYT